MPRHAQVVVVPEPAVAHAVRCANCPTPTVTVQLAGGAQPLGMVLVQVVTPEGLLLLEARAHPAEKGLVNLELMPMDPAIRAWLGGQA